MTTYLPIVQHLTRALPAVTATLADSVNHPTSKSALCRLAALVLSAGSVASAQIGTSYCTPAPNSTGSPAVIAGSGSAVVPWNNLMLMGSNLPANAAAYFFCSRTQGFTMNPGGSAGNLCLGGPIGRWCTITPASGRFAWASSGSGPG